jgi:hypothetical protein
VLSAVRCSSHRLFALSPPRIRLSAHLCAYLCVPFPPTVPYRTLLTVLFPSSCHTLPHTTHNTQHTTQNTTLHTLTHTTKTRSDTYSPRTTHTGAGGVGSATKSREDSDGKDDEEKTKMRGDSAAALQHQYHLPSLSLSVFCRTFVTCFDRRFHFIVKIILLPVSYRVLHFFRMSF